MSNLTQLSDNDLKEQLIQAYLHGGYNTNLSKNIKQELYRRGYDRNTVIHLAITSQIRHDRI